MGAIINSSCRRPGGFVPSYKSAEGYVIGKENCHSDPDKDYWLVDFDFETNTPQIGDTVEIDGIKYNHVLKVIGLDPRIKEIGKIVWIDYDSISKSKIITRGCSIDNVKTYPSREIFIKYQNERR